MSTDREHLAERRDLIRRDLDELAAQVEEAEIETATADQLRANYQAELELLEASLRELPEGRHKPAVVVDEPKIGPPTTRSPRRIVIGSLFLIVALSLAIGFAARDAEPQNSQPISSSPGDLTIDPDTVSNEQLETIVAANPNINGMRMALADRYFAAEDYGAALDHYLHIADNGPSPEEATKALARIGWMAYISGLHDEARTYVEASLTADPTNAEATLFLGFITLYGLGDVETAIPQLEAALDLPNLSANVISQIEDALTEARAGEAP